MNLQLLEYARIELRFALTDLSGGTKGQLESFAEHPPADKNRNPRQQIHMVELEGGKKVKAENTALYVLETRSRRRPMPPMNEYDFAMCGWRRAVNSLREYQSAWVKYCYGHDLKFAYQVAFCEHVWAEYEKRLEGKPLQLKVKKRLIALVWLAGQDVAVKNKNDTYKEYAGAALAGLMGVTRQCWAKTYAHHWSCLKGIFERLDSETLEQILRCESVIISSEI